MKTFIKLTPNHGLDEQGVINWLKDEFRSAEFILSDAFHGEGVYATFYRGHRSNEHYAELRSAYEIWFNDEEISKKFEDRWDWWILEKWYEWGMISDDLEDWILDCVRPADWSVNNQRLYLKNREDMEKALFVFGDRSQQAS